MSGQSPDRNKNAQPPPGIFLKRELGTPGAIFMGLGSMIGTGVFISIGIGAGIAGPGVIPALILAAMLAGCNALNSAQLAACHPVAGGTYEYGRRWLNSWFGFTAGWVFILAKSASAATAALGFTSYLFLSLRLERKLFYIPAAALLVFVLSAVVIKGIRNSSRVNILFVSITLIALTGFILLGLPRISFENFSPFFISETSDRQSPLSMIFHATALLFVAYTGYGRIATLGEEVKDPRQTIPRAILWTLSLTAIIYLGVSLVGIGSVGAGAFHSATQGEGAPLEAIAQTFNIPGLSELIAIGAMTAMLGVLLNLLLGLSRMVMSLARHGDLPSRFAKLNAARDTPTWAVAGVGLLIAALVTIGDIRLTWSFSAFAVLIYYAITNLAALRLKKEERIYSPVFAWIGLAGCLFLAFQVEREIYLTGLALIAMGLSWHALRRKRPSRQPDN